MKNLIGIILAVLILCQNIESRTFIWNGKFAKEGDFPHHVGIFGNGNCGGTIVHKNWILTAAHCVAKQPISNKILLNPQYSLLKPEKLKILAESIYFGEGNKYKAEKVIVHEKFKYLQIHDVLAAKYDIALLKTSGSGFNFSNPNLGCLDLLKEKIPVGAKFTVLGWGEMAPKQIYRPEFPLQYLDNILYTTNEECMISAGCAYYKGVFCLKSPKDYGTCYGDSGGPAIYKGKLAGIVSYESVLSEQKCGTGKPDVFTKVSFFIDWINEKMCE